MDFKLSKPIMACVAALSFSTTSHAAFVDAGSGMVYDTLLDVTWLQDANYAATQYANSGGTQGDADGMMDWDNATAWAASLTVGGVSGWRLPTINPTGSPRPNETGETPNVGNEFGWLWYQLGGGSILGSAADFLPFNNVPYVIQPGSNTESYWTGVEYDATHAKRMLIDCACWDDSWAKSNEAYAWAVHSGDVAGVPEPSTLILMATGLAGVGFARRKKRPLD